MSKYYSDTNYSGEDGFSRKPKRGRGTLALKIIAWIIGILAVVFFGSWWFVTWYFSPVRITALVEEKASEYLDAVVEVGNVNYKLFSSFPWLEFEVDSLSIVSKSLSGLDSKLGESLPENADSLARIARIEGKINIKSLLKKKINLKHLLVESPKVNIVIADSLQNNFSIIPDNIGKIKMPKMKLGDIKMLPPVDFSFFSLPDSINCHANVEDFYLTKSDSKKTEYHLGFNGIIEGNYRQYALRLPVPISLDITAIPDLMDFKGHLSAMNLKVGGITFDLNCNLEADKEEVEIESADIEMSVDNLFAVADLLPENLRAEIPDGLTGIIPLKVNCHLSKPYELKYKNITGISLVNMPSMIVNLNIEDGNLLFSPPGERPVNASHIILDATCGFDPETDDNNWISLSELSMIGEGLYLDATGRIENLLSEEQIIQGDVRFNSNVMKTLSYLLPGNSMKISGHLKGDIGFSGITSDYGKKGVEKIDIKGKFSSKNLDIKSKSFPTITFSGLEGIYDLALPHYPSNNYKVAKIMLDVKSSDINSISEKKDMIAVKGLDLTMNVEEDKGGVNPEGNLTLSLKELNASGDGTEFKTSGFKMDLKGNLLSSPLNSTPSYSLNSGEEDSLIATKIDHTPLYLIYQGEGMMSTLMNMVNLTAEVALSEGEIKMSDYLYPFNFNGVNLTTDLDRYEISAKDVKIGQTSFGLNGVIDGIRGFLTSYSSVMLNADAEIDFENVDINQLSWGYYGALEKKGVEDIYALAPMKPFTKADSTCVVIPRNINATIRLKSKKAEYMQYGFSPLQTEIIVRKGNATLKQLTIGAPYCTVMVDWTYSTQNLNDIFMAIDADIDRFSFKPFFGIFPEVVSKAKEIKNLSGEISAKVDCRFLMYPNMFMEGPSLNAKFDVRGNGLEFARSGKIERLTHLMRIEGSEPIKISNLNITGGFHDNFLQLNPFKIEFGDYRLGVSGVNNMDGGMYYHLALEKSPLHVPFAVNLVGNIKHPEVRLGGVSVDEAQGEKISMDLQWNPGINIMAYLKHGWALFIQQAAKYQQNNP